MEDIEKGMERMHYMVILKKADQHIFELEKSRSAALTPKQQGILNQLF